MSDLTDVEVKLAYMEKAFDDLSDVVHQLSKKIDILLQLSGRVQAIEAKIEPSAPADDKPPHY